MLIRNEDTLLHPLWHFRGTRIMKRGTCIIYDVHLQQPTNLGKANLDSIVLSLFFLMAKSHSYIYFLMVLFQCAGMKL